MSRTLSRWSPTNPYGLTVLAAVATYALIVMGAVVRVTDSGLGCPDWPTCHGSLIPPPDRAAWIEWSHRTLGAVTSMVILAACAAWWLARPRRWTARVVAGLVPVLLVAQVMLGAVVVWLELPAAAVMVHLGIAMAILGALVWLASSAREPGGATGYRFGNDRRAFGALVGFTMVSTFGLIVVGAMVRGTGAGWACVGFPECNGQGLFPFGRGGLSDIQLIHRALALLVAAGALGVLVVAWRARWSTRAMRVAAGALAASVLVQGAIGAVAVSTGVPPLLQALHVAGAGAAWASAVVVARVGGRVGSAAV